MKTLNDTSIRPGLLRGLTLALLAGWLAVPAVPGFASSLGETSGGGYGDGSSDSDSLEDEVGSLPTSRDDGNGRVDEGRDGSACDLPLEPSLVLVGPQAALRNLVVDAFGAGEVLIQTVAPSTQGLDAPVERWTFLGEPTVQLNRDALALGLVDVRVVVGLRYVGGSAAVEWASGTTAPQLLTSPGDLGLPLARLVRDGVLDRGPATMRFAGLNGARASLGLRAGDELVSLIQRRE